MDGSRTRADAHETLLSKASRNRRWVSARCSSCLSKAIPGIPSFYVASRSWHVEANAECASPVIEAIAATRNTT